MRKKLVVLGFAFSMMFSLKTFAQAPTITLEENNLMESIKELEEDLLRIDETIKEAKRCLDEEEARMNEIVMLAQLIEAEAGNQDLHGKILVGNVVMNRVRSSAWPNSIEGVIHQKGQFEVMRNGAFNRAGSHISETSMIAARTAIHEIYDPGIMYFATFKANGRGHWKHGGHWFSY